MRRHALSVIFEVLVLSLLCTTGQAQPRTAMRLDSVQVSEFCISNKISHDACSSTLQFYRERKFRLSWFRNGALIPHAAMLVNTIENQKNDALEFTDSVTSSLTDFLAVFDSGVSTEKSAKTAEWIDVALTAYFFEFFPKLWNGQVDPRSEDEIKWHIAGPDIKYRNALD